MHSERNAYWVIMDYKQCFSVLVKEKHFIINISLVSKSGILNLIVVDLHSYLSSQLNLQCRGGHPQAAALRVKTRDRK